MLVRRSFLTVFFALLKKRFQCYRAHFKFNQIVLVLKLLLTTFLSSLKLRFSYLSQKPRNGGFKCWFEGLFSQFFQDYEKQVSNTTVLISSSIRLFLSSNYFQGQFLSSLKLWFRYLSQKPRYGGFKCWFEGLFSHFFFGLRKVRFQCYCAQFKFKKIVLVLKLLRTTYFIIAKTLVQKPFVEAS